MDTGFPRSAMFICESLSYLALLQPESSGLSKLRLFSQASLLEDENEEFDMVGD